MVSTIAPILSSAVGAAMIGRESRWPRTL
eukprot:SAG11_NODE_34752_length_270_cov_0.742690_1_plen_28_part_10